MAVTVGLAIRPIVSHARCVNVIVHQDNHFVNHFFQGRRQGKSLEGEVTSGVQGAAPPGGDPGAEPLGGGQGAKPPEADTFLVLKS